MATNQENRFVTDTVQEEDRNVAHTKFPLYYKTLFIVSLHKFVLPMYANVTKQFHESNNDMQVCTHGHVNRGVV